ncbi:MAG: hypothetical protein IKL84_03045 [Clostridia bacterium]|nr:hypothetical protein [Clostridia bacterium]
MKRIVSILITALLIIGMTASISAADTKLIKSYADAKDGDLLYIVDFSSTGGVFAPIPNELASKNFTYTVGDDGASINIKGGKGDKVRAYWGGIIEGLVADKTTKYTLTFKVKMNGEAGKNNSIGVGGWKVDEQDPAAWIFYNDYGNFNSQFPAGDTSKNRSALSHSNYKYNNNYTTGVDAATPDKDGFIWQMIEFDGPANTFISYSNVNGEWILNEAQKMAEANDAATPDHMAVMFYSYYSVVDATVKDMKFFKGIGLTDAQLNYVPAAETTAETTAAPIETTAAPVETTAAGTTAPTQSPETGDPMIMLAIAAAVSGIGVALSKKKR